MIDIQPARLKRVCDHCFVITGISSGGKSTLLAALKQRGFAIVEEPGRRIVKEEKASGGNALPWLDPIAFAKRAIDVSLRDLGDQVLAAVPVLFDRGLVNAAAAMSHFSGEPLDRDLCNANRYNKVVFATPPWPEIYIRDDERRHDYADALAEYGRLVCVYLELGYEIISLPRTPIDKRADFVAVRIGDAVATSSD